MSCHKEGVHVKPEKHRMRHVFSKDPCTSTPLLSSIFIFSAVLFTKYKQKEQTAIWYSLSMSATSIPFDLNMTADVINYSTHNPTAENGEKS